MSSIYIFFRLRLSSFLHFGVIVIRMLLHQTVPNIGIPQYKNVKCIAFPLHSILSEISLILTQSDKDIINV